MPRKKKIVPIIGPGKAPENTLTVQKSRPLFSLWRSDMTLAEFKILDTYLSRIDSHQPDKRTVIFAKGELEQLLGVTKINKSDLQKRLSNLYRGVEIEKANSKKLHTVALFEEAYGEADENGLWTIKLTCSAPAMKYIFNIEELGYLRYKLRCITSLTSRYTYVLFMYLESNRFRKTWEVEVDELRHILNCDTEPTYSQFKRFNDLILKKCQKELHEKSECRFSYEPIKTGRQVTTVRFTVETLPEIEQPAVDPDQISLFDNLDDQTPLLRSAVPEFSDAEFQEIFQLLVTISPDKMPCPHGVPDSLELRRYHYLAGKYAVMQRANERKPIKHRFNYYLALLRNDLPEEGV